MELISEFIRLNSRVAAFSSSLDRRMTVEHIPTVAVSIIAKRIHEGINRNPVRVAGINSRESSRGASVGTDCPATCAFVCLLVSQYVFPALFKEYLLSVSLVINWLIGRLKSRTAPVSESYDGGSSSCNAAAWRPGPHAVQFLKLPSFSSKSVDSPRLVGELLMRSCSLKRSCRRCSETRSEAIFLRLVTLIRTWRAVDAVANDLDGISCHLPI